MASGLGGMAVDQPIIGYDSNDATIVTAEVNLVTGRVRISSAVPGADYSLATIGDSITARWENNGTAHLSYSQGLGYLKWALELSGFRFCPLSFAKSSSGMTSLTSATHPTFQEQRDLVIDSGVSTCVVLGGVNDIQSGATLADVKSAMLDILESLIKVGIRVYLCTIPPMNFTYGNYTAARQGVLLAYNAWIRQLCAAGNPGLRLVDMYAAVVNPASLTSDYQSGYSADGLHPRNVAGYWMGKELARAWKSDGMPELPVLLSSAADARYDAGGGSLTASSNNILRNGLFNLGAPVSGVARGWTVAATGGATSTNSLVDHPQGFGKQQQMVIASTSATDTYTLKSASFSADTPLSGKMVAYGEIDVSALTNLKNIRIKLYGYGNVNPHYTWGFEDGTDAALPEAWTGQFRCLLDLTTAGVGMLAGGMWLEITAQFAGVGGATVKASRCSVRDIS